MAPFFRIVCSGVLSTIIIHIAIATEKHGQLPRVPQPDPLSRYHTLTLQYATFTPSLQPHTVEEHLAIF